MKGLDEPVFTSGVYDISNKGTFAVSSNTLYINKALHSGKKPNQTKTNSNNKNQFHLINNVTLYTVYLFIYLELRP